MKKFKPLPTNNKDWGFWGTSVRNGYDAALTWNAASRFLAKEFDLTAEQTRDTLDGRFGRHLADDLSMIKGGNGIANGPSTEKAIAAHLALRVTDNGWRDCFESAITEITGKTFTRKGRSAKDQLIAEIALQHFNIETLETRNSDNLDFHDVAVWCVKDALEAAYEAGRKARK